MNSPFVMIIFGATGDLATHKLIPALFSLFKKKELGEDFFIVGFSRRDLDDSSFCNLIQTENHFNYSNNQSDWKEFSKHMYYQKGMFNEKEGYRALIDRLNEFDKKIGACVMRIFYLATPPDHYRAILKELHVTKLSGGCGQGSSKWTRIVVEKPFGKDVETARALDKKLSQMFEEKQVFRIDHYLGKETVQNMIAFRFANGIFEPVWNKQYVDHVQITWGERSGIGKRGAFFDGVGLLRDVGQNHLMQLLATVAMEQPTHFSKEAIRDARFKAIDAVECIAKEDVAQLVVRGQYKGYQSEPHVSSPSRTETFIAMKLFVDTKRFEGVPFYIRAGKMVESDIAEISLVFRQTCHLLFREYGCPEIGNVLKIRIQPNEGIGMRVIAKKPGRRLALGTVDMKFTYQEEFGEKLSDGYEKLLLDILSGDQMLFNRSDELESSWEFITEILKGWDAGNGELYEYEPGTWGPKQAFELIKRDGRKWV